MKLLKNAYFLLFAIISTLSLGATPQRRASIRKKCKKEAGLVLPKAPSEKIKRESPLQVAEETPEPFKDFRSQLETQQGDSCLGKVAQHVVQQEAFEVGMKQQAVMPVPRDPKHGPRKPNSTNTIAIPTINID